MTTSDSKKNTGPLVAGVDLGGTAVNSTLLDSAGTFLISDLCEHPARSVEGPAICLQQIVDGLQEAVTKAGRVARKLPQSGSIHLGQQPQMESLAVVDQQILFILTGLGLIFVVDSRKY